MNACTHALKKYVLGNTYCNICGGWLHAGAPSTPPVTSDQPLASEVAPGLEEVPVRFKHNGFEHAVDRMAQKVIDDHPGSTLTAAYRAVAEELHYLIPPAPAEPQGAEAPELSMFCEAHADTTLADANVSDPCPLCAADEEIASLREQLEQYQEACGELSPADLEKLLDKKFADMGITELTDALSAAAPRPQEPSGELISAIESLLEWVPKSGKGSSGYLRVERVKAALDSVNGPKVEWDRTMELIWREWCPLFENNPSYLFKNGDSLSGWSGLAMYAWAQFYAARFFSPAQRPQVEPIKFGQPVYVKNPQFAGYGIAQYDSGSRKRVIGVLLENGNTWDYDADTVRNATPEEYDKMPNIIRAGVPEKLCGACGAAGWDCASCGATTSCTEGDDKNAKS